MTHFGTLWGVGVGPGDPQLITFKAARIVQRSVVVAYVVDDNGNSYARQAAAEHIPASACEVPLHFSMSPRREERLVARANAARQVEEILSTGQDVTFITEGDPLLFSTFQHLLATLPPAVPVKVCPGVSALTACAADACFSMAVEDEQMLVATAGAATLQQLSDWLEMFDVVVLFKVHRYAAALRDAMQDNRLLDRAVLVQRASLSGQAQVVELADWDGSPLPYFTTLLIRVRRPVCVEFLA